MCKHKHTSLIQAEHRDFGRFLTVQCDMCGAVLPLAPIPDDILHTWLDGNLQVARMDFPAYCIAVSSAWERIASDILQSDN